MSKRAVITSLAVCLAVLTMARWFWPTPALKDGDLIFQTSRSSQSAAIMVASRSLYSHVGIIKTTPHCIVVVEAIGPVTETPLKAWIRRGRLGRYAVYRVTDLTPAQARVVLATAKSLYGRPYDVFFRSDRSAIYCSELVRIAYDKAGLTLGRYQTIGSLAGNDAVSDLITRRSAIDPECRSRHLIGDACFAVIHDRQLITPKSLSSDAHLRQIYSNAL